MVKLCLNEEQYHDMALNAMDLAESGKVFEFFLCVSKINFKNDA